MQTVREALTALTSTFYSAFGNAGGLAPVDVLYDICLPESVIVNATNVLHAAYTLRDFVEPRRALLGSGALTDFREYEVSERTQVHERLASRVSRYEKAWTEGGRQVRAAGSKFFSFVLTDRGWKIASVLWCDDAISR